MSRDLMYQDMYKAHGGVIPVKWTAPEVKNKMILINIQLLLMIIMCLF